MYMYPLIKVAVRADRYAMPLSLYFYPCWIGMREQGSKDYM